MTQWGRDLYRRLAAFGGPAQHTTKSRKCGTDTSSSSSLDPPVTGSHPYELRTLSLLTRSCQHCDVQKQVTKLPIAPSASLSRPPVAIGYSRRFRAITKPRLERQWHRRQGKLRVWTRKGDLDFRADARNRSSSAASRNATPFPTSGPGPVSSARRSCPSRRGL